MLSRCPIALRFLILATLSAAFEYGLSALHLPAALLLGPMGAAVLLASLDANVRLPRIVFAAGQTIAGCLIAQALTLSILKDVVHRWPLLAATSVAALCTSFGLGWVLARTRTLPGSTAIWGAAPGAATAMIVMAEAFGADIRLVAFMQYLRVVCVAATAATVARLSLGHTSLPPPVDWFPPLDGPMFAATIAITALGLASMRLRIIPAGPMLVPLLVGAALADTGIIHIVLPPWLLAIGYALIGWAIGGRFSPAILRHAIRVLPMLLGSIFLLIGLCAGVGHLLAYWLHISPLTAYLATSPGGADSVAIISASTPNVDVGFIMAMQMARFLLVVAVGPAVATWVANRLPDEARADARDA